MALRKRPHQRRWVPPAAIRLYLRAASTSFVAFPDVVGHRLLDIHILAGLHGPDRGEGVPVIGGRDGHRVDVLVVEHAAHVGFDLGALSGLFKDGGSRGLGAAAVHIHQGGDLDVRDRQNFA